MANIREQQQKDLDYVIKLVRENHPYIIVTMDDDNIIATFCGSEEDLGAMSTKLQATLREVFVNRKNKPRKQDIN